MTAGHDFDPTILREYDVRGVVGKTLGPQDAYHLGRAFGTILAGDGGTQVALGYDGRVSSPELADAVAQGLIDCGLTVLDIGRGPTPMLYYAANTLDVAGGVMVTGSHNPPEHNGFKLVRQARSFFGEDIQKLGEIAAGGAYADTGTGRGERKENAVFDDYIDRLLEDYTGTRALTIAWDAGNGAAGEAMAALTEGLPGHHLLLNGEIDGTFPNHHPDPTVPANLQELIETVRAEGCDLGIAFDGDGDRIGAVDSDGEILWGDQLLLRLARDVLADRPGAPIIADVKSSQVLFDGIEAAGGRPVMWRTGHSLIKSKMLEEGAPLAGEMSAHIFFADRYYGYDDALYAAVRLISAVSASGESLASFRRSLPGVVNTPELRFPCPEERKFKVADEVRERLADSEADVVAIDGVRVKTEDGWWLLRASNTQDVLVARCEARDEDGLARLKASLAEQLRESGIEVPDDLD